MLIILQEVEDQKKEQKEKEIIKSLKKEKEIIKSLKKEKEKPYVEGKGAKHNLISPSEAT